jgi:eukaryotic-like serine/threonine-protein kinase
MPTKIGHFEILSELSKSPTGAVYKANDPESGQTVALKAIQLSAFGDSAPALEQALLAEVEKTKVLSSPNITSIYGAGEMEGQFCGAMEYVQGNSIATMLARKEGFSIWDLLDIGRQLCATLDHATSHNVVHYSLEPAKIMCGWDGTVKIIGFGVSSVGNFAHQVMEGMPAILHYTSPEQIKGEPMDGRSNLFSLGAMLYEMVTERKAFDRDDIEGLRQSILESTPVPPVHVNPKVHPLLSDLIMKALAKDPAERYQSGREVLDDLEKCKELRPLAAKPAAPAASKGPAPTEKAKAAAQSKFIAQPGAQSSGAKSSAPAASAKTAPASSSGMAKPTSATSTSGLARPTSQANSQPAQAKSTQAKPAAKPPAASTESRPAEKPARRLATPKAAAAAAGVGSAETTPVQPVDDDIPEIDLSDQFISASVKATIEASEPKSAYMSTAVADEPQVETFEPSEEASPRIAVDPLMAGGSQNSSGGTSFSEISELPPLKEIYTAPPPPPPPVQEEPSAAPISPTVFKRRLKDEEKPKIQPREVAEKAIKEIKGVPPKLYGYALGGAAVLILAIGIGFTIYVHSLNSDDDSGSAKTASVEQTSAPQPSQPAPKQVPAATQPPAQAAEPEAEPAVAQPAPSAKARTAHKKAPPSQPVIIPGSLAIDSTPQGAQVQLDGKSDPIWVTPFALTNLLPGQHSITVSKAGYSTDTRAVQITAANRATIVVHLSQLMATLVVKSDPVGANVYVDGRDTGTKTPAQVSIDKGQHTILVRMPGYLDETMSTQFVLGQTFNFAPTLRPLGNVDNIRTVGKMSKLFGGKGAQPGQATINIHTQPKGAQVAINQHLMEKNTPMDVAVDPGNYVIDITLTGYAPVHKVITADKGGKINVDEVLTPQ